MNNWFKEGVSINKIDDPVRFQTMVRVEYDAPKEAYEEIVKMAIANVVSATAHKLTNKMIQEIDIKKVAIECEKEIIKQCKADLKI